LTNLSQMSKTNIRALANITKDNCL